MIAVVRIDLPNLQATARAAAGLARAIGALDRRSLVLDLRGPLGSGKTAFVRLLAAALGLAPGARIVSPTFTIQRTLALGGGPGPRRLHHIDAYRLDGPDDLEALGGTDRWEEDALVAVEWGDRVASALGEDRVVLEFETTAPPRDDPAGSPHAMTVRATGPLSERVVSAWLANLSRSSGVDESPR